MKGTSCAYMHYMSELCDIRQFERGFLSIPTTNCYLMTMWSSLVVLWKTRFVTNAALLNLPLMIIFRSCQEGS